MSGLNAACRVCLGLSCLCLVSLGCQREAPPENAATETAGSPPLESEAAIGAKKDATSSPPAPPVAYEVGADELLAARLAEQEVSEGWIRLFDGHTLFGWEIAGDANWRIDEGAIVVDQGEPSLLCTSMPWQDYELRLEYRAAPETNSGIFLRTPLQPDDPAIDCYEVNIAPPENAFPTGVVVKRMPASQTVAAPDGSRWQSMTMVLKEGELTVSVDGEIVTELKDPM